jgi:sterol desaturase/sphingolipid hydroxylase (fatty acid hydroxylase superfamily)
MSGLVDHALPLGFMATALIATHLLLGTAVPVYLVSTIVVAPLGVLALVLERVRPERLEHRPLDQPLAVDLAHFFLNYQLGYGLALGGCALVGHLLAGVRPPLWPGGWPLILQIVFAGFLAELVSYWQHRLSHRLPWLWRFHALHHSGGRLNLLRSGRFHFVDIGAGAFLVFVPLIILGAPEAMVTWIASISGVLGILEHANMRMRTPAWLDAIVCTPAVHRHHHSRRQSESDSNFATLFTFIDVLFGTFRRPDPVGPEATGIDDDPVPRGFWPQVLAPFRRDR